MKSKKIFKSLIIVFALLISGIGFMGFSSPQKAEAKDWLHTYKSGNFTNYVIFKKYHKFTKKQKNSAWKMEELSLAVKGKGRIKYTSKNKSTAKALGKQLRPLMQRKME